MTAYPLLFLAGVSAVEAWTGVTAPVASLGLRASRSSCGLHAATMAVDHSSDGKRLGRRATLVEPKPKVCSCSYDTALHIAKWRSRCGDCQLAAASSC